MLADPVHAQAFMPPALQPFRVRPSQYLDEVGRTEAFTTLRQARDARQELACLHAVVTRGARLTAVIARATRTGKGFVEVMQLDGMSAVARFRVIQHLAQLLASYALLVLERLAGIRIDLFLDEKFGRTNVGSAEEQGAARRISVASGAAGFLVVAFQALGQVVMNDPTDVRLIDAHSEGDGRDDDLNVIAN